MPLSSFSLKPFSPAEQKHLTLSGTISREVGLLLVRYTLSGALHHLRFPSPAEHPARKANLWQASCFEFFFAETGSETYREVNLSPSGDWNVYRFISYRQGMEREKNVTSIPCRIAHNPQTFTLEARFDLSTMSLADKPLRMNISAVLLTKNNTLSHWALDHPCEKPDFHTFAGFLLTI